MRHVTIRAPTHYTTCQLDLLQTNMDSIVSYRTQYNTVHILHEKEVEYKKLMFVETDVRKLL